MHWTVYALLGAFAAALGTVFAKVGLLKQVDSGVLTTVRGIVMAGVVLAVTLSIGSFSADSLRSIDFRTWFFIVCSGICGALSWVLFYYALATGTVAGVTSIDKLSVVMVIALATLFLGEKLTLEMIIGATLITLGTVLVSVPKEYFHSLLNSLK
jgi:bacterial/archaeal transporter family protein